ncbi:MULTISPECIES: DUF5336 domain-containing protein [Streptomyces]|uniref:Integral membrane protein n=2 Tax=Streptomyces avermitilis TaxID=33903 RepID=Q82B42_STRAW|nr:DUF5336 domain-containing protein [Streptomyces avermitilis]MYT01427.1 hypothetical protein [Streptomyces sp. SID5469]OOV27961.1 hypothetical protein SM007_18295 [Streptomyces avermitilis]BAC73575.1 putative integral membrane protein [Streptomyces avermitilis MA-4680 = NBRC 14893]BBJ54058.1 hypothetical protein SAVMC3_66870 [Streptomyces avermitilis]GDY66069.1 hypothetical protein SAV14893_054620 [Streptomyces avermitilis]
MNIRSLTRGDGVVIGAAVLLFIASFLDVADCSGSYCGSADFPNAWSSSLGLGLGTYMIGVVGAALILIPRALPQPRKVAGLDMGTVGVALTVASAWSLLWWTIDANGAGAGLILGMIAALILAGAAIATPLVPALKTALVGAPRPVAPQPYGAQPPSGYGYPGAQQPGQPYGGQPQPQPGQPFGGQPQAPQQAQAAQPAGDFSPFWFAVPVARPLYAEDGSPTPIAELAPGTWYLAVEQRGAALVAQTQDGRRGVLQDASGIQRG